MDNHSVILTTPEELQAIVDRAVERVLPKLADFRRKNEAVECDNLSIDDAVQFITQNGIPTTKTSLYNFAYRNAIPYRKVGHRLLFSKRELTAWIESRTTRPSDSATEAALQLAACARRKEYKGRRR